MRGAYGTYITKKHKKMVERILSISGKPGLYRLVNQGKNMLIVENIETGKRQPAYSRDKVMSLGDIAIYTTDEDKPLYDVFELVKEKTGGKPVDLKTLDNSDKLREYFGEILPDYDRDRVYTTDIRKLFQWYNTLIANGVTEFKNEDIAEDKSAEAGDPATADAPATFEAEKAADK